MRTTLAALVVLAFWATASNAQTPGVTKVSLKELHCEGCLKKVTKELVKVPGVTSVRGDLDSATLFISHKPGMNPSPRGMWEAIEKGSQTPTRMEGPTGIFTQKPPQ